jgi:endonuclease-3 related protein
MNHIHKIFLVLYSSFGPQGWWPLTIKCYNSKHYSGRPKKDKHRFEIIIGAILTQNTNWKNVEKALYNLSKNDLIDIKKISKINQTKLGELIKPAGYFNQKAERLKIISDYILENYKGNISEFFDKEIKELREELLKIKGIGPETADSIILYAAEKPIFVIDAYTKRIFERLGFNAKDYGGWQNLFMSSLKKDLYMFKEYHALIVELGKNYCKTKPECMGCPLSSMCKFS